MSKPQEFVCTTDFDAVAGYHFVDGQIRVFPSAAKAEEEFRKLLGQDVEVIHKPAGRYCWNPFMKDEREDGGDVSSGTLYFSHVRSKKWYGLNTSFASSIFTQMFAGPIKIIMMGVERCVCEMMRMEKVENFAVFAVEDVEAHEFRFDNLFSIVRKVQKSCEAEGSDARVTLKLRRVFSGFPMSELLMSDLEIDPRDMIMDRESGVFALSVTT